MVESLERESLRGALGFGGLPQNPPNFPSTSKTPQTSPFNTKAPRNSLIPQKALTQFPISKKTPNNCDNYNSARSLHTHHPNPEKGWIFDCGATDTMTFDPKDITQSTIPLRTHVQTASGDLTRVKGAGTINITPTLQLSNCLYVPSLSHKLLSISHVTKELNCAMIMHPNFCYLQDTRTGEIIGRGTERNGLYYVDEIAQPSKALFTSTSTDKEALLWHRRFGHPSIGLPGMAMVDDPSSGSDKHLTSWTSPNDPSEGEYVYKIENHGLTQLSVLKGSEKKYRTGSWNGLNFVGQLVAQDSCFNYQRVFNNGRLISLYMLSNTSHHVRVTMNYLGLLEHHILNEQRDGWILQFSLPADTCDKYGLCGANSMCSSSKRPVCSCLKGFVPKSKNDWDVYVWTSGCVRSLPSDCEKEDGFMMVEHVKFPDTLSFRLNDTMTVDECRLECSRNCNCSAYASPYLINQKNGCLMWLGDLVDVKEYTGEVITGTRIYIRVPKSVLDWNEKKVPAKFVIVMAVLVLVLAFGGLILRTRRKRQACKKERGGLELPLFRLTTIAAATNNFSDENLIGEGGFGPVYKGKLSSDVEIAVKRMSKTSGQGTDEFKNEAILIAKLQHKNLVRILGCCIKGEEKMLIYEYMQNKSLDYFIFDQSRRAILSWPMRFDIIMGIARGLLYLHHDSRLRIIHRDLKTSNILLDESLKPKISDFGLARMFEGDQSITKTKRVVGTYGYMAPEYVFNGKFSVKSDVFSLGVVILEIVSGKRNRSSNYPSLLEQAWLLWQEKLELELMDECYNSSYVECQVRRCIRVGLLCVQDAADDRPMMPAVVQMLSTEDQVSAQPKKPGFFMNNSSSRFPETNAPRSGSMTVTQVEAR